MKNISEPVCPGFKFSGVRANIKKNDKPDLGLIISETPANTAGVFTQNRVKAACVTMNHERIAADKIQAIIVNSGNANCCNGDDGMADAISMAASVADRLGIPENQVLTASTGVIGQRLPIQKIQDALPKLVGKLDINGAFDFANAIMTTDLVPKIKHTTISMTGKTATILGIAKGSGMIRPDMATMLCFLCTDVAAPLSLLKPVLTECADASFNRISIDGDTSTNDMVLLMANGKSGIQLKTDSEIHAFKAALEETMIALAKMIVKDGEGATKLIEIIVKGAITESDARKIADTVAHSNLVKTAFFGEDANWGRIIAAAGRAHVPIDPDRVAILFDDNGIFADGRWCGEQAEAAATRVLRKPEFKLTIDLNMGNAETRVWTCDFSIDYVKINADYRS